MITSFESSWVDDGFIGFGGNLIVLVVFVDDITDPRS